MIAFFAVEAQPPLSQAHVTAFSHDKAFKWVKRCYLLSVNFFLKLLKAKTRNEIRGGKLWKITRIWGKDAFKAEQELAKPEPFKRPEGGKVDALRVHIIKGE